MDKHGRPNAKPVVNRKRLNIEAVTAAMDWAEEFQLDVEDQPVGIFHPVSWRNPSASRRDVAAGNQTAEAAQ